MTEQRIKLAEAMGWRNCEPEGYCNVNGVPTVGPAGEPPPFDKPPYIQMTPDPFTDANDDYAVLEWAKSNLGVNKQVEMRSYLRHSWGYEIGDYARAALKLMDNGGD